MRIRQLLFALAALAAHPALGREVHADGRACELPPIVEDAEAKVVKVRRGARREDPPHPPITTGCLEVQDVRQVESRPPCPELNKTGMAIEIEAVIDGRDHLIIQGGTIQWRHYDWAIAGRHEPLNEPTVLSTMKRNAVTLDHFEWFPEWRDLHGKPVSHFRQPAVSSRFNELTPPLPSRDIQALLTPIKCRGIARILQQPSAENDYALVVEFDDNAHLGAVTYKVRLTVPGKAGTQAQGAAGKRGVLGPAAYFPLDGSLDDHSGNKNKAIANGDIAFADGVSGQAARMDGLDDFIEIRNEHLLNSQSTVAFWVKLNENGDYSLVSKALLGNGYGIWLGRDANFNQGTSASGLPSFGFDGCGTRWNWHMVTADTAIGPNHWHHVAAVLSDSGHALYIDGQKRAVSPSVDTPSIDAPIWLGREMRLGGGYLNGLLDEVQIYSRALSSHEVGQLYKEHAP